MSGKQVSRIQIVDPKREKSPVHSPRGIFLRHALSYRGTIATSNLGVSRIVSHLAALRTLYDVIGRAFPVTYVTSYDILLGLPCFVHRHVERNVFSVSSLVFETILGREKSLKQGWLLARSKHING